MRAGMEKPDRSAPYRLSTTAPRSHSLTHAPAPARATDRRPSRRRLDRDDWIGDSVEGAKGKSGDHFAMKVKVVVHQAEEGGYWAEVPSIPGCATQGETFEELLMKLYEAVEGCLSIEVDELPMSKEDKVIEIAV